MCLLYPHLLKEVKQPAIFYRNRRWLYFSPTLTSIFLYFMSIMATFSSILCLSILTTLYPPFYDCQFSIAMDVVAIFSSILVQFYIGYVFLHFMSILDYNGRWLFFLSLYVNFEL